ncbi:UvrD-helicase domain-containing protein [Buchnera aphidicola]|uniref:UvrD-helicase domain-containing protein n=1 Tax=Buchnera aphidicola TaxID=9 RepID=UPI0031B878CC
MFLNKKQKLAVNCISGPCLVLAGAGSGKTKIIIEKIIYLINHGFYKTKNIFALTFTNKAAKEIKKRISKILGYKKTKKIFISTFHSFGMNIIKKEIKYFSFNKNFILINEYDQISFFKKITKKYKYFNKIIIKKLILKISYWKNNFLFPHNLKKKYKNNIDKNFITLYKKYLLYTKKNNYLDFNDLICLPLLLFKKYPKLKLKWRSKIKYLLIDEYQDTNFIQYKLIKFLKNINSSFTLVGDHNQCIYSWRGANFKNIILLKKDYPNIKIIKMERNYRSIGRILNIANILISNNKNIYIKKLFSKLHYGEKINICIGNNEIHEAEIIIKKILFHYNFFNKNYKNYAVLYRNKYQIKEFIKQLNIKKIPYEIINKKNFIIKKEIKYLLYYLKLLINNDDDISFLKIINKPNRNIGLSTLQKIFFFQKKKKYSFFNCIRNKNIYKYFNKKKILIFKKFIVLIKTLKNLIKKKPENILKKLIKKIKYKKWIIKKNNNINKINIIFKNISLFKKIFKKKILGNKKKKPMSLKDIIEYFILNFDNIYNNNKKKKNKIQLMTLHSSKGLEFSYVYIIGIEEGILPNKKNDIEEERRLMYVGITRAKNNLTLSFCKKRLFLGKYINTYPSRFLLELPKKDIIWKKKKEYKLKNINKLNIKKIKNIIKLYKKKKK